MAGEREPKAAKFKGEVGRDGQHSDISAGRRLSNLGANQQQGRRGGAPANARVVARGSATDGGGERCEGETETGRRTERPAQDWGLGFYIVSGTVNK